MDRRAILLTKVTPENKVLSAIQKSDSLLLTHNLLFLIFFFFSFFPKKPFIISPLKYLSFVISPQREKETLKNLEMIMI